MYYFNFLSSIDASETCTSGIRVSSIFSSFTATLIFCVIPMIGNWIRNYERMKFERRWEDWVREGRPQDRWNLGAGGQYLCRRAISSLYGYRNRSKTWLETSNGLWFLLVLPPYLQTFLLSWPHIRPWSAGQMTVHCRPGGKLQGQLGFIPINFCRKVASLESVFLSQVIMV